MSLNIEAFSSIVGARWIQYCATRGRYPHVITQQERDLLRARVDEVIAQVRALRAQAGGSDTSAPPQLTHAGRALLGTIMSLDQQMDTYEQSDLLDEAMAHIPLQELHEAADARQAGPEPLACFEDALAEALVKWFKPQFFKWADPMPCPTCSQPMASRGHAPPTPEERGGGAGVVELYACDRDGTARRFPRYNELRALMKSRIGRCGEFANLFALFLRAVGLRARYVWNAEDHVWNEYYSPGLKRWVHLDSCECARDESLLYDRGWGKKMSYVLAFGTDGARDVTRAYVQDWPAALQRRNRISEAELARALEAVTARRRFGRHPDDLARLEAEDSAEARWLATAASQSDDKDLAGRTSGSKEWVDGRGEGGKKPEGDSA